MTLADGGLIVILATDVEGCMADPCSIPTLAVELVEDKMRSDESAIWLRLASCLASMEITDEISSRVLRHGLYSSTSDARPLGAPGHAAL
jgi:hypothetical protein